MSHFNEASGIAKQKQELDLKINAETLVVSDCSSLTRSSLVRRVRTVSARPESLTLSTCFPLLRLGSRGCSERILRHCGEVQNLKNHKNDKN